MGNFLGHQGNAQQIYFEISSDRMVTFNIMLARMWIKRNTHMLLIGVQICTAAVEISAADPHESGNRSTPRFSYTTLGHIHYHWKKRNKLVI